MKWNRLIILASILFLLGMAGAYVIYLKVDRYPGELMRYAERRLQGHNKLEFVILPIFKQLRSLIEKPVDNVYRLPDVGQQAVGLIPQTYDADGHPIPAQPDPSGITQNIFPPTMVVKSGSDLASAMSKALAGDIIEILPGTYVVNHRLYTAAAGRRNTPIVVRSAVPGQVILQFKMVEGFRISHPYWIFENLIIEGKCASHGHCEHAFHVVGEATNTVIRNNTIKDFNSHVKINGYPPLLWPDYGLFQFNTLHNGSARHTASPVNPFDLVGANNWLVTNYYIGNFIKAGGNGVSIGVYMKGSGAGGVFKKNQIVCTESDISQAGIRVGLSFGGGATGSRFCRDNKCDAEFYNGIAIDNLISHCNDVGIYVNNSKNTLLQRNTLINTYGIDIRYPQSTVRIKDNVIDGRIRTRDGGKLISQE